MSSNNLEGMINVEVEITQMLCQFEKLFTSIINQIDKFGSEQIESTPRAKQNEKQAPNIMKEFLQQKVEWIELLKDFLSQYTEKFNEYKEKKFSFNRLCQEEYLKTKRFNFSCNLNYNLNLQRYEQINFGSWDKELQNFDQTIGKASNMKNQYKQNYENLNTITKQLEAQILIFEQYRMQNEELQQQQNLLIQQQQQLQQQQQKELVEKQIQDVQKEYEEAEKQRLEQVEQTESTQKIEQVQEIVNQPDEQIAQEESDKGSETNEMFYWCQKCRNTIETNGIQLGCQHFFHSECLKELIQYQISNAYIKCDCNTILSSKLIINFLKQISKQENNNYLEQNYLNNQALNFINKFNHQRCNCGFFYLTPGEKCENVKVEKCVQCQE